MSAAAITMIRARCRAARMPPPFDASSDARCCSEAYVKMLREMRKRRREYSAEALCASLAASHNDIATTDDY